MAECETETTGRPPHVGLVCDAGLIIEAIFELSPQVANHSSLIGTCAAGSACPETQSDQAKDDERWPQIREMAIGFADAAQPRGQQGLELDYKLP